MGKKLKKPLHTGVGYPAGVARSTMMIEGHRYFLDSFFEKKSVAKRQAAYLRKPGTLSVRVVQTHGGWAVFRYHKEGAKIEEHERRRFRKPKAKPKKRK